MKTLDQDEIKYIFKLAAASIQSDKPKSVVYLEDIKPLDHQSEELLWRYRLDGFLHAMEAQDSIDLQTKSKITQKLLGIRPVDNKHRSGRNSNYSVDIITEQGREYSFDVPSMNPTDAYFQLTKRVAYKSIPDIKLIEVFSGLKADRDTNSSPTKVFSKSDLIYVSLV